MMFSAFIPFSKQIIMLVTPSSRIKDPKHRAFIEKIILKLHSIGAFLEIRKGTVLRCVNYIAVTEFTTMNFLSGDKNFAVGKMIALTKFDELKDDAEMQTSEYKVEKDLIVLNGNDENVKTEFENLLQEEYDKFKGWFGPRRMNNITSLIDGISGYYSNIKHTFPKIGYNLNVNTLNLTASFILDNVKTVDEFELGDLRKNITKIANSVKDIDPIELYPVDVIKYTK